MLLQLLRIAEKCMLWRKEFSGPLGSEIRRIWQHVNFRRKGTPLDFSP